MDSKTLLEWTRSGFRPLTAGAAAFTFVESAIIVGGTFVVYSAAGTVLFEVGIGIGSAVQATFPPSYLKGGK